MGSSKKTTVGYNYFGSFAQALGLGPATRLTRITNGETEVWTGDLDPSSADGDGLTLLTTTLGTLRFYWGTDTQNPDTLLQAAQIDFGAGPISIYVPAWRGVIYYVADDIAFGGQPVPPSLKFEFERQMDLLDLTFHAVESDAVIPEVIYELLSSTLYGAGVPTADLATTAFEAAAEILIAEGIAASPFLDENSDVREFIGKLLAYIDGYLRFADGQISLGLMRKASTAGLQLIDESLLADEPRPINEGWKNTWNFTRLIFTDRENEWEADAVETYEDIANAALLGERTDEEIKLPFITRRAVAKLLAKRKALKGGLPAMTWELETLPSLRTLRPGDRAKLTFAKRGIDERVVRILEVNRSARDNRLVKLTVEEEITRDESHDYVPPADDFGSSPDEFQLADTTPRLSWLTSELKEGAADGFLVACHRPHPLLEGFQTWFTWDPLLKAYGQIALASAFPAAGEVAWWCRARNNTGWLLRIEFQTAADAQRVSTLLAESADVYAAVGRRLYKSVGSSVNQHQVDVLWLRAVGDGYLAAISATELVIEFAGAAFGSVSPAMETLAANGVYPTLQVYAGLKTDFTFIRGEMQFERNAGNAPAFRWGFTTTSQDTDLKRYVAAPTYNLLEAQDVADAGVTIYDRNDTTMCPEGTYDNDWGARVATLAELFDYAGIATVFGGVHPGQAAVAELDAALFALTFGIGTADEALLAEDTNDIFGYMTLTGATWYNKA